MDGRDCAWGEMPARRLTGTGTPRWCHGWGTAGDVERALRWAKLQTKGTGTKRGLKRTHVGVFKARIDLGEDVPCGSAGENPLRCPAISHGLLGSGENKGRGSEAPSPSCEARHTVCWRPSCSRGCTPRRRVRSALRWDLAARSVRLGIHGDETESRRESRDPI